MIPDICSVFCSVESPNRKIGSSCASLKLTAILRYFVACRLLEMFISVVTAAIRSIPIVRCSGVVPDCDPSSRRIVEGNKGHIGPVSEWCFAFTKSAFLARSRFNRMTHMPYHKKYLQLIDQCAELFVLKPSQLGDDGEELCLCLDDERGGIGVLVDIAENKSPYPSTKIFLFRNTDDPLSLKHVQMIAVFHD